MAAKKGSARARRARAPREQRQILIVDDEESLAFFLRQGLLEADPGWLIDTAATGEEAVIKINRFAYRLIISDLRMPGLNGLELIQMIRALEPQTRVVLMTAYGSSKVEEEARRLGVFRYLAKPFAIEEVKALATEALGAEVGARGEIGRRREPPVEPTPIKEATATPPVEPGAPLIPEEPESPAARPIAERTTVEWRDSVLAHLARFRSEMGAKLALVASFCDDPPVTAGDDQTLPIDDLVALCARSLQAALEARHVLGQDDAPAALLIQQGERRTLCSAVINPRWMLVLVFDRRGPPMRLDSVASAVRQAAGALGSLIDAAPEIAADGPESESAQRDGYQAAAPRGVVQPEVKQTEPPANMPAAAVAAVPGASDSESLLDADDEAEDDDDQVFSLDQAQALGLIDKDLIARILGE